MSSKREPLCNPEKFWETLLSRRDFAKLTLGAIGVAEAGRLALAAQADRKALSHAFPQASYGIGPCWPRELGDVRAEVRVTGKADAVRVRVPWRRRDLDPQAKAVIVVDAKTGKTLANVAEISIDREFGDLVFQPETAPGNYFLYYLPYHADTVPWRYSITYLSPKQTADAAWLARHQLAEASAERGQRRLPEAKVLKIQARSDFDRFDPMEVTATPEETRNLLSRFPGRTYLTFPEARQFPIRMSKDLPLRWIEKGPATRFHGAADRGEFYVFQVGIYACGAAIQNLSVRYGDLASAGGGGRIPRTALRCFNLAGTDWVGRAFRKTFSVARGSVRALWFGIQIPRDAAPGNYHGTLVLRPEGAEETSIRLSLTVSGRVLEDAGDSDLWRQARLRWLDSTICLDDEVTKPFTPLKVQGRTVHCLGREVRFAASGFPESIRSNGLEILAAPVSLVVETAAGKARWNEGRTDVRSLGPGSVVRQTNLTAGGLSLDCQARMAFDGYVGYHVRLKTNAKTAVSDIRLELPLRSEVATYMMGLGRKGGYRPKAWKWVWDINRANNEVWVGEVKAGLQLQLKGTKEVWNLFDLKAEGIPKAWGNQGKGGCTVTEEAERVMVRTSSGQRTLEAGEELWFNFALVVTPAKPLNPDHWSQRYYQQGYPEPGAVPVEQLVRSGATIVNIHQGNELNPYINYPFLTVEQLASYVNEVHAAGMKAKIYYTVRELSNRVAEMWALRSLDHEIFTDGPGGGGSWLCEHLVSHYAPGWHQTLADGDVDEAILQTGLSRWHNYYLEGLAYLLRKAEIDGLYLDGIGYDRQVMKRVRKVLDRNREGSLIDFHSGNEFPFHDLRISPANKYMELFPYIDSLWFGEGYNYNESPDYWLVEISGLPFGLFSDMLQGGGNPWRGMIYGMATRHFGNHDPSHIWNLWSSFGIQDAEMIGYWDSSCPVRTDRKDVLATVYKKKGSALISVASWAKDPVSVTLEIDWAALGLEAKNASLTAPAIPGFQLAKTFSPAEKIPVDPAKGWLLILQ